MISCNENKYSYRDIIGPVIMISMLLTTLIIYSVVYAAYTVLSVIARPNCAWALFSWCQYYVARDILAGTDSSLEESKSAVIETPAAQEIESETERREEEEEEEENYLRIERRGGLLIVETPTRLEFCPLSTKIKQAQDEDDDENDFLVERNGGLLTISTPDTLEFCRLNA